MMVYEEEKAFVDEIDPVYVTLYVVAIAYFSYFTLFVDQHYGIVAVAFLGAGLAGRMAFNLLPFMRSEWTAETFDTMFYGVVFAGAWVGINMVLSMAFPGSMVEYYTFAIILVGVAEETFYNYFLFAVFFTVLVRWLNDIDATIISLVLIGLFFYMIHPLSLRTMIIPLVAFRIFQSIIFLYTKRIGVPVVVHVINNLLSVLVAG